jgi:putative lipoprotein
MCLTHRVRQQAGSCSNLRNNPKSPANAVIPRNNPASTVISVSDPFGFLADKEHHMKRILLALMTTVLAACAHVPDNSPGSVDGEVFYLQRMALPPTATLKVSLQDVSVADAPAQVLASQSGPIKGQVPLPFHLTYDQKHVQPGHTYAVSARIEVDGELLMISAERYTVDLTLDEKPPVKIRLSPAR